MTTTFYKSGAKVLHFHDTTKIIFILAQKNLHFLARHPHDIHTRYASIAKRTRFAARETPASRADEKRARVVRAREEDV